MIPEKAGIDKIREMPGVTVRIVACKDGPSWLGEKVLPLVVAPEAPRVQVANLPTDHPVPPEGKIVYALPDTI